MQASTIPLQTRWQEIKKIWKDNRWLYVIAGILIGILSVPAIEQITGNLNALVGNLVPETIGIIFTVLILNTAADNRAKETIKQQLLAELNSSSTAPAVNALDRLRREEWLDDDYFVGKNLGRANWEGAYIGGLNFEGANLNHINFKNVTILNNDVPMRTNLECADLKWASLEGANFEGANLEGANLWYAGLECTNLWHTNLKGARLAFANLKGARLWSSNLEHASLREANLLGSDFKGTNLEGVLLQGAILPDGKTWEKGEDMGRFTDIQHPDYKATLKTINTIRQEQGIQKL